MRSRLFRLPSNLIQALRLVPQCRVEADFTRRIHEHSCSDQARKKKARKAIRQAESSIERCTSGCQSIGRLCGARSRRREEARSVRFWQSGDSEGGKEKMAKVRKKAKTAVS